MQTKQKFTVRKIQKNHTKQIQQKYVIPTLKFLKQKETKHIRMFSNPTRDSRKKFPA